MENCSKCKKNFSDEIAEFKTEIKGKQYCLDCYVGLNMDEIYETSEHLVELRNGLNEAIRCALDSYPVSHPNNFLGQEYLDLFGHKKCFIKPEDPEEVNYYLHICFCLKTMEEIRDFGDAVLKLVNNYTTELRRLKEEMIARVDKYFDEQELNDFCHNNFNEEFILGEGTTGEQRFTDWRDYARRFIFNNNKEWIANCEKSKREIIDQWVRLGYTKEAEERAKENSRRFNEEHEERMRQEVLLHNTSKKCSNCSQGIENSYYFVVSIEDYQKTEWNQDKCFCIGCWKRQNGEFKNPHWIVAKIRDKVAVMKNNKEQQTNYRWNEQKENWVVVNGEVNLSSRASDSEILIEMSPINSFSISTKMNYQENKIKDLETQNKEIKDQLNRMEAMIQQLLELKLEAQIEIPLK